MKRLAAAVTAVVAVALTAGLAAGQPKARLTIKAPGATAFGRQIEIVGRLVPAARGTRVVLYSRDREVTATALRGDGTYRFRFRIGTPGPFHVEAKGLRSPSATIRLVPVLTASVGPSTVGRPLVVHARVEPAGAGSLRVSVTRNGTRVAQRNVAASGVVPIEARGVGAYEVSVEVVPRRGYVAVSRVVRAAVAGPTLSYGSRDPAVRDLATELARLSYVVPDNPSTFDGEFIQSVYAFQKDQGLPRTGVVDQAFWARLASPAPARPRYREPADHIEVSKAKQVLYLVRGGAVRQIIPVSTAGIAGYYTPVGRFAIYRKVNGYDNGPLGTLLRPMYFLNGYAIHGNPSVPPYPASHGCIRVPNFVINRLFLTEPYGETVYVY